MTKESQHKVLMDGLKDEWIRGQITDGEIDTIP